MDSTLRAMAKLREEYLWLVAEIMTERTTSGVLVHNRNSGNFDNAKEFLKSLIHDKERRWSFFGDEEYLLEGATESDMDLLIDDYIPVLLKNHIEYLQGFADLPQSMGDEIAAEVVATRRKRPMGFIS